MSKIINGLAYPTTPEKSTFDFAERTDLAVATFESLGLVSDKGAAVECISRHMQNLQYCVIHEPSVVAVEPFIAIELTDKFGLVALREAFNSKKEDEYIDDSSLAEDFWSQYTTAKLNSRRVGQKCYTPIVRRNEVFGEARGMVLGNEDNAYNEAGLYHTDKSLDKQIKAAKGQDLISPADYMILQAQRREAGLDLLDTRTATRFVQLEKKSVRGNFWAPSADGDGCVPNLELSKDEPSQREGIRFSMGPKTSSSVSIKELLEKGPTLQ